VDALADHHRDAVANARLSHRHHPWAGCGSTPQPRQERDGGINPKAFTTENTEFTEIFKRFFSVLFVVSVVKDFLRRNHAP